VGTPWLPQDYSITTTVADGSEQAWPWYRDRDRLARNDGRERTRCWDRNHVIYCLTLLACGILFGLFVGGIAGFMDAATPAADAPGCFTQMATSDVQWTAKARQYWATSHHLPDSGSVSCNESRWQRLVRSTNENRVSGAAGSASCSFGDYQRLVQRQSSLGSDIQDTVVTP
jgi:hypothetical protein